MKPKLSSGNHSILGGLGLGRPGPHNPGTTGLGGPHSHHRGGSKSADIYHALGDLTPREPDGHNNDGDGNDANDHGFAGDTFLRITLNSYTDAVGAMATPAGTTELDVTTTPPTATFVAVSDPVGLPQAETISTDVMDLLPGDQDHPSSFGVNEWFDFFGQIVTHDVAEASTDSAVTDPLLLMGGLPFPFARTGYETDSGGVRQQINEETSFLDLGNVYGDSQTMENLLRADTVDQWGNTIQSAKLLLPDGMLPTLAQVAADSGTTEADVRDAFFPQGFIAPLSSDSFIAGDNRVDQQPPLTALQTIWAREHNYQVDQLTPYAEQHGWTQDQLFEAARAITEAEWQHVIYDEYLPKLTGTHADALLAAYYADPSHTVDTTGQIINEWTTVAFRFGHDQSSNDYVGLNEDGSNSFNVTLEEAFTLAGLDTLTPSDGTPDGRSAADIDAWIRGLTSQITQELDGKVADGNREFALGINTLDLEAFDIQRGRDHGVWNYNDLRDGLGLQTYDTWDEFQTANDLSDAVLDGLKSAYGSAETDIANLDSIVGGLLEQHYCDSQLGDTFTLLTTLQFDSLKNDDNLFYTTRLADDPQLIAQIDATSFADILQRDTGIDYVYHDAFAAHTRTSIALGTVGSAGDTKELAIGSDGNDWMTTYGDSDDLYGGQGNDVLNGGEGNDYLWGGEGKDIFVFGCNSGYDVVKDFDVKNDKLDLTAYGIDSWRDVRRAVHNTSDGVTITLDNHDTVELVGVKLGQLSSKDFIHDHHHDYGIA